VSYVPNMKTATLKQNYDTSATRVDMKLEVAIIPVSDVERSKRFYQRLGWRFDDDVSPLDGIRIVQFTPPGSACSVTFGKGITAAAPGSAEGGPGRLRHRNGPWRPHRPRHRRQ
jgi:catechol 2,3-dioxygenase-like lactoylglutathione lyase family enzyme